MHSRTNLLLLLANFNQNWNVTMKFLQPNTGALKPAQTFKSCERKTKMYKSKANRGIV